MEDLQKKIDQLQKQNSALILKLAELRENYRQPMRPRGTDNAKVIQVIRTRSLCGIGTPEDPARELTQYWDFNGSLLASHDGFLDCTSIETEKEDEND